MNNKNYNSFESIFNNIKGNRIEFYIDIINEISNKFYDNFELFRLEEDIAQKHLDLERLFLSGKEKKYSVHKNIVFTHFLNIKNFFFDLSFFQTIVDYDFLIDSQKSFVNFITFKYLLELNLNIQKSINNKEDSKDIQEFIAWQINIMNNILEQYKDKYNIEFCKYSISSLKNIFKITDINISDEMKQKINENNYLKTLNNLIKTYNNCCSISRQNYVIYSIEQIMRMLNISNEICYQIFYK